MPLIDRWEISILQSDGTSVHCGRPMADDIEYASCPVCPAYASTADVNVVRRNYGFTERWPAGSSAIGEHLQRY